MKTLDLFFSKLKQNKEGKSIRITHKDLLLSFTHAQVSKFSAVVIMPVTLASLRQVSCEFLSICLDYPRRPAPRCDSPAPPHISTGSSRPGGRHTSRLLLKHCLCNPLKNASQNCKLSSQVSTPKK